MIVLENCQKSAVKHSIEKPILVNFVNLFTLYQCHRLHRPRCGNLLQSSTKESKSSNPSTARINLTVRLIFWLFLKTIYRFVRFTIQGTLKT